MVLRFIALCATSLGLAAGAVAQDRPAPHSGPVKVIVETFDNQVLTVKTDQGKELSVNVPAAVGVTREHQATAADIKSGQVVHCTTIEGSDGKTLAQSVYVLPDAMRGGGEGHFPRANVATETMTNGTIGEVTGTPESQVIKVNYKGGQSEVKVPKDVKVTITELASTAALKPGTEINLFAQESPPGKWTAFYISILR